jgi:RNA polymerase sigma factor (sigma-70 family)
MATAQLGAVLRHIRAQAATQAEGEPSDGALLRAFLSSNDQAAFEALLRRHGPMVLRVCRRTLGHAHDADDAFQATFLVLARQAGSIRKLESLASWLHGVAHRMATHAKRAAARRRGHESCASPIPPPDPALNAAWQEIQALLDEEIDGLPEALRAPFVSCYLENTSCARTAELLGLKESTIHMRLSRARKLLQERLRRRGVSLTAVLAAVAVGANGAGASLPRGLVGPTVKAAAQVASGQALSAACPSAQVLALVEGVNQAMFLSQCKTVIVLLLGTALVGAALGLAVLQRAGAGQPATKVPGKAGAQPADATAKAKAGEVVKVRGRVFGLDGKPLAGARLYLSDPGGAQTPTYPVRSTSGADGRFAFTFAKRRPAKADFNNPLPPATVLAVARGHGCAWGTIPQAEKGLDLRLVKDVAVSGRIVDADGQPVANARLRVDGVSPLTGAKQSGLTFAFTLPWGDYTREIAKGWAGPLPGQPTVLTTGADGKFRLTGVGPDRVVSLHLEAPGIATTDLGVISGASVEHLTTVSRPIRGVVRDKATGKPLAGATVFVKFWINPRYEEPRWGKAVSDKQGRYELLGLAKQVNYSLMVKPARGDLYLQREIGLRDAPGLGALAADIDMVQGLTVRGKVIDKATGKPVAHAVVDYRPLYANPHVGKLPGFWTPRSETTTGPDGAYALTVLPGAGVIGVVGPDPDAYMTAMVTVKERKDFFKVPLVWNNQEDYLVPAVGGNAAGAPLMQDTFNFLVLLDPTEKDKQLVKDIALERPLERKGRVVGPDGETIPGVTVSGLLPRWYVSETLKGAEFTVRGLNPRSKRQLIFHHKGKNLGFCLKNLPEEKLGPLTIKLQPCGSISGRVVDQDGQPVAGVHLDQGRTVTTDKQGRFRVAGLVPGTRYTLMKPNVIATVLAEAVIEPGKNKDLGDLKIKR